MLGAHDEEATSKGDPLVNTEIWLPLVDAFRTLCVAPTAEIREILEQSRMAGVVDLAQVT